MKTCHVHLYIVNQCVKSEQVGVLPSLGLNADPVLVSAAGGSETDAGNRGEGLQTALDDGLLARG